MKPASPVTATTLRSGSASFAAIAPGTAMPIEAKPFEMMQVLGASASYMRAIHILCAPTSLIAMSSGPSTWRRSWTIRCGLIGKLWSSVHECSSSRIILAQPRDRPLCLGLASVAMAASDVRDVANHADLEHVVLVDLGR